MKVSLGPVQAYRSSCQPNPKTSQPESGHPHCVTQPQILARSVVAGRSVEQPHCLTVPYRSEYRFHESLSPVLVIGSDDRHDRFAPAGPPLSRIKAHKQIRVVDEAERYRVTVDLSDVVRCGVPQRYSGGKAHWAKSVYGWVVGRSSSSASTGLPSMSTSLPVARSTRAQ